MKAAGNGERASGLWLRYTAWLREECPEAYANLSGPATEAEIRKVEDVTGVRLPESVKAVWRLNNGQKNTCIAARPSPAPVCLPSLSFLSTKLVIAVWKEWAELRREQSPKELAELQSIGQSAEAGRVRPLYTHPHWIPLWSDPLRSDYVGLDLSPARRGVPGQIINFGRDEERHFCFADSFEALLEILVEEVESGAWPASQLEDDDGSTIAWIGDPEDHFFNELYRRWEQRQPNTEKTSAPSRQARALVKRAEELYGESKPREALDLLARARSIHPALGAAFWKLFATVLDELGRHREADVAYRTLVQKEPRNPEHAFWCLYNVIYNLHDYKRAAKLAREFSKRFPSDLELLALRALVFGYFLGRHRAAIRLYQQALQSHPNDAGLWGNQAFMLVCVGRTDDARAAAEKALSLVKNRSGEESAAIQVEALFYLYALAAGAERSRALARLRIYLEAGQRTENWNFDSIIGATAKSGRDKRFLKELAQAANGRAELKSLSAWPEWKAAAAHHRLSSRDLTTIIGQRLSDPKVQRALAKLPDAPVRRKSDDDLYHVYRVSGVELVSDISSGRVSGLFLHAKDRTNQLYRGGLPNKLHFDMSQDEVHGRLGEPDRNNGLYEDQWDFGAYRFGVKFSKSGRAMFFYYSAL